MWKSTAAMNTFTVSGRMPPRWCLLIEYGSTNPLQSSTCVASLRYQYVWDCLGTRMYPWILQWVLFCSMYSFMVLKLLLVSKRNVEVLCVCVCLLEGFQDFTGPYRHLRNTRSTCAQTDWTLWHEKFELQVDKHQIGIRQCGTRLWVLKWTYLDINHYTTTLWDEVVDML